LHHCLTLTLTLTLTHDPNPNPREKPRQAAEKERRQDKAAAEELAAAEKKRLFSLTHGLTSQEAMQQAQAEGLTLLVAVAANAAGYFGVSFQQPGSPHALPCADHAMFRHGGG